jgi:transcription elongation factor GreA
MSVDKVPMTAGGYAALELELKRRQSEDRPRIIEHIAEARSHGDLSENAEYHAAKDRQSFIEGRMMDLEDKISRAQVIDLSKLSGKTVTFGATVTLGGTENDSRVKYQIVGDLEADLKHGRVSISSPIARALIGRVAGDVIEVSAPGGARSYEILNVSFA